MISYWSRVSTRNYLFMHLGSIKACVPSVLGSNVAPVTGRTQFRLLVLTPSVLRCPHPILPNSAQSKVADNVLEVNVNEQVIWNNCCFH